MGFLSPLGAFFSVDMTGGLRREGECSRRNGMCVCESGVCAGRGLGACGMGIKEWVWGEGAAGAGLCGAPGVVLAG